MKVLVEAYGCTMNRGEAEEFADAVQSAGHACAGTPEGADVLAVFTCGVIEATERRMLRRISLFAAMPGKRLLVCGCLPNICPEKVKAVAPDAELVGPSAHMWAAWALGGGGAGRAPAPGAVGILPVATGCSGECAYCITRKARGRLRSRPPEGLAPRLRSLVDSGAAEIQLCGQDTAAYGRDIGLSLADLVGKLTSEEGDFMLRIGMMNPATLLADLDGVLSAYESPKVFKFLHLPVQSGSDRVLASMNRRHTAADFESQVSAFRARFPGLSLSTDIITGFPGETDEDFLESLELVKRVKPDIVNVTRFSSRPGTAAHAMGLKVPSRVSKDRSRLMTDLRFRITAENYASLRGTETLAMATERRKPGTAFLRTPEYKPVVVRGELPLGAWYNVHITGRAKTHLLGRIV